MACMNQSRQYRTAAAASSACRGFLLCHARRLDRTLRCRREGKRVGRHALGPSSELAHQLHHFFWSLGVINDTRYSDSMAALAFRQLVTWVWLTPLPGVMLAVGLTPVVLSSIQEAPRSSNRVLPSPRGTIQELGSCLLNLHW